MLFTLYIFISYIHIYIFSHCSSHSVFLRFLLIFFMIILLICQSSDFHGFIKWHGLADLNFTLWYFRVVNAIPFWIYSTKLSRLIISEIYFVSRLIAFSKYIGAFLYFLFRSLSFTSFLYSLGVSLYMFVVFFIINKEWMVVINISVIFH